MSFAQTVNVKEIEMLEQATFLGEIMVISDTGADFSNAISYLSSQPVLGFDTETKPCFVPKVPRNRMAILQLSTSDKAYIFRLQQTGVPKELAKIMSNPRIIKVGAAIHDDIKGLQTYRVFDPKGFVDLQKVAAEYGIQEKSVRKMAAIILKKRVSKSQQLSNWEASKLSDAQLRYAAIDAWICKEMFDKLKNTSNEQNNSK